MEKVAQNKARDQSGNTHWISGFFIWDGGKFIQYLAKSTCKREWLAKGVIQWKKLCIFRYRALAAGDGTWTHTILTTTGTWSLRVCQFRHSCTFFCACFAQALIYNTFPQLSIPFLKNLWPKLWLTYESKFFRYFLTGWSVKSGNFYSDFIAKDYTLR